MLLGAGGAWVPFLALHLERAGQSEAIGTMLVVMGLARVVAGPLWGIVADWTRRDGPLLALGSGITAALGAAVIFAPSPLWIVPLLALHATCRAPLGALLDGTTVRRLEAQGRPEDYGRVRRWGSVGYLVAGLVAGAVAESGVTRALGLAVAGWALTALLAARSPSGPPAPPAPLGPAIRAAARNPRVLALLAVAVLHGASLATYDSLYAVHLDSLGIASRWAGLALTAGVAVEVAAFTYSDRLIARVGPWTMILLATLSGVIRWELTAWAHDPYLLTAVQLIHGVTFGFFWLGVVEAVRREVPEALRMSSQALLVATTYGLGPSLCGAIASWVLPVGGTERVFTIGASLCIMAGIITVSARRKGA